MVAKQLEDLLRDELAGDEPPGAWECALQSLFLRIDPSALSRIQLRKLRTLLPAAIENLRAWTERAKEIGALSRLDPNGEIIQLQAGLSDLEKALGQPTPTEPLLRELYMSVIEQVDEEVFQFLSRQDRFYRLVSAHLELLEPECKERLKQALKSLEEGLANVGIERSDSLRGARTDANFVTSAPFGEQCTVATLVSAMASWKLTRCAEETRRTLRRAWSKSQRDQDAITGFLGRFLGNLDSLSDEPEAAWPGLLAGADYEGDDEAILEAVRLAIRLRKWDQAGRLVQSGLETSTLFAIRILAMPEAAEIAGDIIGGLVERQRAARQEAGRELTAWNGDANRIRQAAKTAGTRLDFTETFDDLRKSIAPRIGAADLFQASALRIQARNGRHESTRLASQHMGFEHAEAVKVLEAAKAAMDHAWVERDAMIEAAVARQKAEAQIAREALQSSLKESEKNQAGCVVGLGSGCGAFVLYLMIAAFLTAQGVNAGFGTIFGWFGLAASGIPIGIAVMAQVGYGAQRAALDRVLHDKIKMAQQAYEAASKYADQVYREQVLKLRDGLGDLETKAHRLEEGLKILNGIGAT